METVTMIAEINQIDMPIFEALLKKFNAKKIAFEETRKPNKKTIQAIKEGDILVEQYKKGKDIKGYTDIQEMFNDILTENE